MTNERMPHGTDLAALFSLLVALMWLVPDRRIEQLFDEILRQEEG